MNRKTLLFMPHCPQRLYENMLLSNWTATGLNHIVMIGNQLSEYGVQQSDVRLKQTSPHLFKVCNSF